MFLAKTVEPTTEIDPTNTLIVCFLVIPAAIAFAVLIVVIIVSAIKHKYRSFVSNHSVALRELETVNRKYNFLSVPSFNYSNSYDNQNFYSEISPIDYLTYQLVYDQKRVIPSLGSARKNHELYKHYYQEINNIKMNIYDTEKMPKSKKLLVSTERKMFCQKQLYPVTDLLITVKLILTDINGRYQSSKKGVFDGNEITYIIKCLGNKRGNFYLDENIWNSICRVERGKVSNRMRFAIYRRDGNRCRKCGRRTNDLEIDHILPISKGGKSTMDNLQTLCRRCNDEKGNRFERYL